MKGIMNVARFVRDETGAAAIEHVLLGALVPIAILSAAHAIGTKPEVARAILDGLGCCAKEGSKQASTAQRLASSTSRSATVSGTAAFGASIASNDAAMHPGTVSPAPQNSQQPVAQSSAT